jgi:hypothetical protein
MTSGPGTCRRVVPAASPEVVVEAGEVVVLRVGVLGVVVARRRTNGMRTGVPLP